MYLYVCMCVFYAKTMCEQTKQMQNTTTFIVCNWLEKIVCLLKINGTTKTTTTNGKSVQTAKAHKNTPKQMTITT